MSASPVERTTSRVVSTSTSNDIGRKTSEATVNCTIVESQNSIVHQSVMYSRVEKTSSPPAQQNGVSDATNRKDRSLSPILEMTEEPLNQEEVLQLDVHCSNRSRGCRKTMPLKDLDSHLRECLYGVVHCPLKCGQGVTIRSLTNHMASECPRRVVNCSYCSEETVLERQELHEKGCHKRPVTCIYCQKDSLVQGELNRHLDVCLMRPRKCRLAPLGCKQTGTKTEMDEHEKSWENHMDLVLNLLMQRNNFSDSKSRNRFQEIVTIVKDLNTDNEYLQEKIEIMKQRMESLQKENDLLRSQVYKIEMAHKKDVDLLRSSLSKCQRTIEELQRNVTELQKCNDIDSGESEV